MSGNHVKLKSGSTVDATATERRMAIIAEAERIFGDPAKANRWLSKPKASLDGKSPFEVLERDYDFKSVQSMLVRIEHGMIG